MSRLVIVWGTDDFNTLGLLRELNDSCFDVFFLIKGKKHLAYKSRYCKSYHCEPSFELCYEYLLNNFCHNETKPLIITNGDDTINFIDLHKEILERYFILSGCQIKGQTIYYNDKNNMTKLATELGFDCPVSYKYSISDNFKPAHFPIIVKPAHLKPGFYNEFKFKICHNIKEFDSIKKYLNKQSEFIIQNYINKKYDALIYGVRLFNSTVLFAGCLKRFRTSLPGSTSYGTITCDIPSQIDLNKIKAFVERIQYFGLFSIEYAVDDAKAYFLEINLRNDGTSHYFYQCGANLPLLYTYSCFDFNIDNVFSTVQRDGIFIDELYDIENCFVFRMKLKQYFNDKKIANVFRFYDNDDKRPFAIEKRRRIFTIIKDLILTKFRHKILSLLQNK